MFCNRKELKQSELALADSQAKQQEMARESEAHAQLGGPLPFNASLNPLTVHLPAQPPRPPNMRECEVIIRHLQMAGDKQAHEVRLRLYMSRYCEIQTHLKLFFSSTN